MAIVACAVTGPGVAARQEPQATFRSATRLIVQTVTVRDRDGKPVEGLTASDFTVTENGERQDIAFVEFQRFEGRDIEPASVPPSPALAPAAAAPAVARPTQVQIATPPPGGIQYRNRRLVVLYFDLSAMPPPDQARAYANARAFIDSQMSPADLVAVMSFQGGAVRVRQDFTDNRAALQEAVLRMMFGDDLDGDGIPDNPDPGSAFGQDDAEFNIFNTDRQLSALQTAVTMLRDLPERKSLVYFASGLRLNGTDNQAQLRATVNAAVRANVAIFPIDARGLVAQAPLGDATRPSPGGLAMFSGRLAEAAASNMQRSQDTLYALAGDTGGKAMFDYNDLSLGIRQAAAAIGSYYIVGFYSTHTVADGKFRQLRVALAGGRTADVSYRTGYFGDREFARFTVADRERQLEDALMLENPITDITIAMEVNYFQLNRAEYFVPVAVKIPGSELALARRRGAARTTLDFIAEVKTESGVTIQNVRDQLNIRLSDETAGQLATRPIQYETGFTLLPDRYVIKFLARDSETGRIGTYQTAFTIPNLNREEKRVPISTVVLSSQRVALGDALYSVDAKVATLTANPLVQNGQKLIPSVTRVFSKARDLYVFLQAYQRTGDTTQPLVAFVSLFREEQKVFETLPLAISEGLEPRTRSVPVRFSVPLASIAPGRYDCQVTVLDPGAQKATFWRAPVVIVP
jgi:VWFA-related protein